MSLSHTLTLSLARSLSRSIDRSLALPPHPHSCKEELYNIVFPKHVFLIFFSRLSPSSVSLSQLQGRVTWSPLCPSTHMPGPHATVHTYFHFYLFIFENSILFVCLYTYACVRPVVLLFLVPSPSPRCVSQAWPKYTGGGNGGRHTSLKR